MEINCGAAGGLTDFSGMAWARGQRRDCAAARLWAGGLARIEGGSMDCGVDRG